ncbi:MAG: hypothetical protein H2039_00855 [Brevundimonas sp.]|jgi:hypothetical protein|nr:hypothetical protein [Brevundimonas sp.]
MTPAAFRAVCGALNWSLREAAAQTGVAVNTLRLIGEGQPVTEKISRRVLAAFRREGVRLSFTREGQATIILGQPVGSMKHDALPAELLGVPFLAVRPRADGTHRVFFEVHAKDRPEGWPATRPLPFSVPRRGNLCDPVEVKAIRADAKHLEAALLRQRAPNPRSPHSGVEELPLPATRRGKRVDSAQRLGNRV